MKLIKDLTFHFLIATLLIFILGCGYDPQDSAYDTSSNPDGYPAAALQLLNDIDSDLLYGAENIGGRFAELYTAHSDLLDNVAWKKVIKRLGAKFSLIADTLAASGPESFNMAAGYYNLASFARPEDNILSGNSDLFRCWTEVMAAPEKIAWPANENTKVSERLSFIRQFWTPDNRRRKFARTHLLPHLLDGINEKNAISPEDLTALDPADKAFASMLGFAPAESIEPLALFEPGIKLLAARVTEADSSHLLECYFVASDKVTEDYSVLMRVASAKSQREALTEDLAVVLHSFEPLNPSSGWKMGQVQAAYYRFEFGDKIPNVGIGLFVTDSDPVRLANIIESDKNYTEIRVAYSK